jgi:hypothetical protein
VRGEELTRSAARASPHLTRLQFLNKFLSNAGFYAGLVLQLAVSFAVVKHRNGCYLSYKLHVCLSQISSGTELLISFQSKLTNGFVEVMSAHLFSLSLYT